jgi:hypothetical protein
MRQGLAVGEPEQPHCLRRQRRDIEQSDYVEAHSNLGVALQQQRKLASSTRRLPHIARRSA